MGDWHYYKPNPAIDTILASAPCDYRATTEYALSILGINDKQYPPHRRIYVREKEISEWRRYLASVGVQETVPGSGKRPDLILDSVKHLPRSLQSNSHVVNLERLLKDLHGASPRLFENSPGVISKLKNIA